MIAVIAALAVAFLVGSMLYAGGHEVVGIGLSVAALLAGYLLGAPSSPSAGEAAQSEVWGKPVKPEGFERPPGGRDLL